MPIEEEWLSQILGENTRKAYIRSLRYFKEFMKIDSTEDLIKVRKEERNFETRLIQFYQWLQKSKGVTPNTSRNICIGIQSLFAYAGSPLKVKNKLPRMHMKIENWKPTLEDLQKIYSLGDISVKAWMNLSRDIPGRMSDMLKITPEQVDLGEFQLLSKKEGVIGKCYTSEQTRTLFRQLGAAKITLPRSQRGVDKMMSSACRIAGTQRLNQHLWRKIFITTAVNQGVSEMIWKILTFKTVPLEQLTYFLDSSDLRTYWEKIVKSIPLEAKANGDHAKFQNDIEMITKIVVKIVKELRQSEATPSYGLGLIVQKTDQEILEDYLRT
jgi:hypothetical protein